MGGKENVREQNAYSELYIEDAMCNMANLVDYVVNDLHRIRMSFLSCLKPVALPGSSVMEIQSMCRLYRKAFFI